MVIFVARYSSPFRDTHGMPVSSRIFLSLQYFANSDRQTSSLRKIRTPIWTIVSPSSSRSSMNPPFTTISFSRSAITALPLMRAIFSLRSYQRLAAVRSMPRFASTTCTVPVARAIVKSLPRSSISSAVMSTSSERTVALPGEQRALRALREGGAHAVAGVREGLGVRRVSGGGDSEGGEDSEGAGCAHSPSSSSVHT